ncbi:MAG: hypothetical protein IKF78_09720 [Atopobiaceae bacterium]|nr:hypothetical protein [Atopobiaceae bacterium]
MDSNQLVATGFGIASLGIVVAIVLVFYALFVVANWRMFTKAGEKGWKSLIPIYSDYTLFKLVWNTKSFWIYVAMCLVCIIAMVFSGSYVISPDGQLMIAAGGNAVVGIVYNIASIVVLVYMSLLAINTSLAYGKGMVYAIGLLLLPGIFRMILGFGSAEYRGPRG